jgi:hypothetical protein
MSTLVPGRLDVPFELDASQAAFRIPNFPTTPA